MNQNEPDPSETSPSSSEEQSAASRAQPPALPREPGALSSEDSAGEGAAKSNRPHEPMEKEPGIASVIDALLKSPSRLLYEWQEGRRGAVLGSLAVICVGSFAVFGLLLGLFAGGTQLWAVPLKVLAGAALSGLITLPSLYVFASLGGLDMTLRRASGLLVSGLALIGVILSGLAPVLWIFTQSTNSIGFMGFLVLIFWLTACGFGLHLVQKNARTFGSGAAGYLALWTAIFLTVTLQMSTSMRPLLGPAAETILPTEKRFFAEHWFLTLTEGR